MDKHPAMHDKSIATMEDNELWRIAQSDQMFLEPYEREFIRWLTSERTGEKGNKYKYSVAQKLAKLKDLTGDTWTLSDMRTLAQGPRFREYYLVLREKALRAAQERLGELAYKAVENLDWAMDEAKAEGDYGTMPKITGQILERAMPRREDLTVTNQSITIIMSERQAADYTSPVTIVEALVLPDADDPAA